jgi:arsenate reductase
VIVKLREQAKSNVLFICIHNSARSQMAEAWVNQICGDFFAAESAGLEPGTLNPLVVEAMQEVGIDISNNETRGVFDTLKAGKLFSYVITVCDEASAEKCPIFPGAAKRLHWGFADPSALVGSREQKLVAVRRIRDEIRDQVQAWCRQVCPPGGR